MAMDARESVPEHNRRKEDEAIAHLRRMLQEALQSSGKATMLMVRVPVHGGKLGDPVGYVERKF